MEKGTQEALDLYQKIVDSKALRGFYDMTAVIGGRASVRNPATDGLTSLDKATSLGDPPALTELGRSYIYVVSQDELGLRYMNRAAGQGYASVNYELAMYYRLVTCNYPEAVDYYLLAANRGNNDTAFFMPGIFNKASPDVDRMWYASDERLHKLYDGIYDQPSTDPDLRFPDSIKDHPLPPHPTRGYDADRPDWKPGQRCG